MRRAARKDANEAALRARWEAIGGSWLPITPIKGGEPDALLGFRGQHVLVELKDGAKPPSARRLRKNQIEWHRRWCGGLVHVVLDTSDLERLAREMGR